MPKVVQFVNTVDVSAFESACEETKKKVQSVNVLRLKTEYPTVAIQWNGRMEVVKTHQPKTDAEWLSACTEANIMLHLKEKSAEMCSVKLYKYELIGHDGKPLSNFEAKELLNAVNPLLIAETALKGRKGAETMIREGLERIQDEVEKIVLVMEYGVPLSTFMQNQDTISEPEQKVKMLFQSLEHLHRIGIIHEDVKPSNLVLVKRADAVVPVFIDYNVSAFQEVFLIPYAPCKGYTDYYKSPEQADDTIYERAPIGENGKLELTKKTDVYSMAVIAFELMGTALPKDRSQREQFARAYAETSQVYAVLAEALNTYPDNRPTAQRVAEKLAGNSTKSPKAVAEPAKVESDSIWEKIRKIVEVFSVKIKVKGNGNRVTYNSALVFFMMLAAIVLIVAILYSPHIIASLQGGSASGTVSQVEQVAVTEEVNGEGANVDENKGIVIGGDVGDDNTIAIYGSNDE